MAIQRHGMIFENHSEADRYFANQKCDADFKFISRVQELRNARAVLETLSGMEEPIDRINAELKGME